MKNLKFIIGGALILFSFWIKDWVYYMNDGNPSMIWLPILLYIIAVLSGLFLISKKE